MLDREGWRVSRWRAGHMEWVDCPVHSAVVLGFERDGKLAEVSEEEMSTMAVADAFDVGESTWNDLLSSGAPCVYDIDSHYEVVRGHSGGAA